MKTRRPESFRSHRRRAVSFLSVSFCLHPLYSLSLSLFLPAISLSFSLSFVRVSPSLSRARFRSAFLSRTRHTHVTHTRVSLAFFFSLIRIEIYIFPNPRATRDAPVFSRYPDHACNVYSATTGKSGRVVSRAINVTRLRSKTMKWVRVHPREAKRTIFSWRLEKRDGREELARIAHHAPS